jgi:hypothetical protein
MVRHSLIVLSLLLAGCGSSGGAFGTRGGGTASSVQVAPSDAVSRPVAANGLSVYFETLRDLIEGNPVVQADTFRAAADAANLTPTTTNRLNLALALATPGHPASNPLEAQRQLMSLLAASDTLLSEERTLALVYLKEVEQRLILEAEAQRLQRAEQAAAAAKTQQNDDSEQRLEAALEENRQLQGELDEAKAKLDAITNIERSIREREHAATPR